MSTVATHMSLSSMTYIYWSSEFVFSSIYKVKVFAPSRQYLHEGKFGSQRHPKIAQGLPKMQTAATYISWSSDVFVSFRLYGVLSSVIYMLWSSDCAVYLDYCLMCESV